MRITDRLNIRIGDKLIDFPPVRRCTIPIFRLHKDPPVLMTAGVRQKFCYETVDYDV